MKTEALIDFLARGAGPAPGAVAARRLIPAAAAGVTVSVLLVMVLMGPVPAPLFATPAPWIKLSYAALLALATGWMAARLGRPVSRLGGPVLATLVIAVTMAALGLVAWLATPAQARPAAVLGHSWFACPWNVLGLSLPALVAALWALRGLAPTRPRRAGLAAGLFAGALGAAGYALGCREESTVFVALWYSAGIAASGLIGALIGPRVLRW
jgi:hypothetical protein